MSSVRAFAIIVAVTPALLLGGLSGYALRTAPAPVSNSCDIRHSLAVAYDICGTPERSYDAATRKPTH